MLQEPDRPKKWYTNTDSNSKSDNKDKKVAIDNENSKINYFFPGLNHHQMMARNQVQQLQRAFKDVFFLNWVL